LKGNRDFSESSQVLVHDKYYIYSKIRTAGSNPEL
jgi:hypothetical protein